MSIREALANMTRGAGPALVGGFLVEFNTAGKFIISLSDGSHDLFDTPSLIKAVDFIESSDPLTGKEAFKVEAPAPLPELADDQVRYIQHVMGRASRHLKSAPSYDAPIIKPLAKLPELTEEQIKYTQKFIESPLSVPYGYVNTEGFNTMCQTIHRYNKVAGWWNNIETGEPLNRNVGEMLMLVVSEISEAMEGHRKDLMDDKLPHRKMMEVELADAVIRICDIAGGLGLDVAGAIQEKVIFNMSRPDHKIENRLSENGKKY